MNNSKTNLLMGEALRKLRLSRKQSQEFVADCLNISRTAYKGWENGKIDFSLSKLERISEFYEVPLGDLLASVTTPQKSI